MTQIEKIPYVFILEHLGGTDLAVKPMFGGHAVYSDAKLCLFLLRRAEKLLPRLDDAGQNGLYVATTSEHAASLKRDFPDAEFQQLKAGKVWIFFPEESTNFEAYAVTACELIAARDPRIGR